MINATSVVARLRAMVPDQKPADTMLTALWLGLGFGWLEAGLRIVRHMLQGSPRGAVYVEMLWMAPADAALVFLVLAAVALVMTRATRGFVPTGVMVAVGTYLGTFGIVTSVGVPLQRYAFVILSVAVAVRVTQVAARRPDRLRRIVRSSVAWMVGLWVVLGAGITVTPFAAERLAGAPAGDTRVNDRPNVLLIILDTVRSASLSLYGYERETTPNLTRFAEEGTVFTEAIATSPWTLPSHASVFTGYYPHALSADWSSRLDGARPTIAEVLADAGYVTAGFVANTTYASTWSGLNRGFARYQDFEVSIAFTLNSWSWTRTWSSRLRARLTGDPGLGRKTAETINREFLDWLANRPDRPFFAFLNYFDAHDPYLPPAPYNLAFADSQPQFEVPFYRQHTPETLRQFHDAYDGCILYLDHQLGILFQDLADRGLLDNTLVIVSADHGEEMGEHSPDLVVHGHSLYLPALHVPLIVRLPGASAPGTKVDRTVSIRDIPATIVDFLGLDDAPTFPGTSLLAPAITDSTAAVPPVLSEVNPGINWPDVWPAARGPMKAVLADRMRYILGGDGAVELYDLRTDPDERINRADSTDAGPDRRRLASVLDSILNR